MTTLFDGLRQELRAASGATLIADLGVVDHGKLGHSECTVTTGIEHWQGLYFVWISVLHRKNRAGSSTRVIKWPYSHASDRDLERVIADFRAIENTVVGGQLPDNRGWFARAIDKLSGCEHLGERRFTSPLDDEARHGEKVVASVVRWRDQLEISMTEQRKGGASILAQFPHKACGAIRKALVEYAQKG